MLKQEQRDWLANWARDYEQNIARRHPDGSARDAYASYREYDEDVNVELESLRDFVLDIVGGNDAHGPRIIYTCTRCGSPRVQAQAWVDANTDEVLDDAGGDHWCNECEDEGYSGETKYLNDVQTAMSLAGYSAAWAVARRGIAVAEARGQ